MQMVVLFYDELYPQISPISFRVTSHAMEQLKEYGSINQMNPLQTGVPLANKDPSMDR